MGSVCEQHNSLITWRISHRRVLIEYSLHEPPACYENGAQKHPPRTQTSARTLILRPSAPLLHRVTSKLTLSRPIPWTRSGLQRRTVSTASASRRTGLKVECHVPPNPQVGSKPNRSPTLGDGAERKGNARNETQPGAPVPQPRRPDP